MAIRYNVQPERQLVILTADGTPDLGELEAALDAVAADRWYRPGFGVLLDARARASAPSATYVESLVAFIVDHPRLCRSRWAFLTMNPAVYGMARMAEIVAEQRRLDLRAFLPAEYDAAVQWLAQREPLSGQSPDGPVTALATFEETAARAWATYREATLGQPLAAPGAAAAFDQYVDAVNAALAALRADLGIRNPRPPDQVPE